MMNNKYTVPRQALLQAVKVILQWHGKKAFETYYDHSPEMKMIRNALGSFKKIKDEPISVTAIPVKKTGDETNG